MRRQSNQWRGGIAIATSLALLTLSAQAELTPIGHWRDTTGQNRPFMEHEKDFQACTVEAANRWSQKSMWQAARAHLGFIYNNCMPSRGWRFVLESCWDVDPVTFKNVLGIDVSKCRQLLLSTSAAPEHPNSATDDSKSGH